MATCSAITAYAGSARFRAAAARHSGEHEFSALIDRLHAASSHVRDWWPSRDIASLGSGAKRLHHPALGEIELRHVVLLVAEDPEQKVVSFTADDVDLARIAGLIRALPPHY